MITIRIYTLTNPINDSVFYVGRTSLKLSSRLDAHIAASNSNVVSYKNSIIKTIMLFGKLPVIEELETFYCKNEIEEIHINNIENYWITQFRAWGFDMANVHGISIAYKNKPLIKWNKRVA